MSLHSRRRISRLASVSLLVLGLSAGVARAESIFTPSSDGFQGQVRAGASERGAAVIAGSKIAVTGERLIPGQKITLMRGNTVLTEGGPLTVNDEGKFRFELTLDKAAHTGLQPILVITENPASATVVDLKISPDIPFSGAEQFEITSAPVTPGLYQLAFGSDGGALFVTSSVGRPPVRDSSLNRIDPATLKVTASVTPGEAPPPPARAPAPGAAAPAAKAAEADDRPPVFAVYGIGADEANKTLWVTNTRQDTVAVYNQDDLSLVRQFEPGAVPHAFAVQVDESQGRAYISEATYPQVAVFDTKTLEQLEPIRLKSDKRGEEFRSQGIWLDEASSQLFVVSLATSELAVVDLKSGESRNIALPGAIAAAGVAYDPVEDLLFVTAQDTDNLLILKASDGTVLSDVDTGAGALYVTFEPESRQIFVGNRGAGSITVVNTKGEITANLELGSYPNQLIADGQGNVWAVNKSRGEDDDSGDRIWKIAPKAQ